MTTIRTSCPDCGDLILQPEDFEVRVDASEKLTGYSFRCPEDGARVFKLASRRIIELLVDNGVQMIVYNTSSVIDSLINHDRILQEQGPMTENEMNDSLIDLYRMSETEVVTGFTSTALEETEDSGEENVLELDTFQSENWVGDSWQPTLPMDFEPHSHLKPGPTDTDL